MIGAALKSWRSRAMHVVIEGVGVSVPVISHHYTRCMPVLDAYWSGFTYGSDSFKAAEYGSHRRVGDKSKY